MADVVVVTDVVVVADAVIVVLARAVAADAVVAGAMVPDVATADPSEGGPAAPALAVVPALPTADGEAD